MAKAKHSGKIYEIDRWPQQFEAIGKKVYWRKDDPDPKKKNMGWLIFPYGDCVAAIWFWEHPETKELLWKCRAVRLGGAKGKIRYYHDLLTIKKEKVFEVTEAIREIAGMEGITKEEVNQMLKERKERIEDEKIDELINKFSGGGSK